MEDILKNIPQIVVIAGGFIGSLVGFFQWLDQRNRELEERQSQSFHKMACLASGADESGKTVQLAQQLAAIYQLQRYKKYSFASIPTLQYVLHDLSKGHDSQQLSESQNLKLGYVTRAINETLAKLS